MILNKINLLFVQVLFSGMQAGVLVNVKKIIPSVEIDLKYATTDNFVGKKIYNYNTCYLLLEVAEALKKVQAELSQKGLGLKIFDGYRTMQAQRKFWEVCPDERYVSNPDKEMGRHTRGTAVDLTLIDLKTKQELEMPTGFDDFTEKAAPNYEGSSKAAIKNRTLLQEAMRKYGFTNNRTEWWHFDFKGWQKHNPLSIDPKNEDRIEFNLALEIREVRFEQIKEVSWLYHQSWHDTYDVIAPHLSAIRTQENCFQQWVQYYHTKNHFILIALEDKKIVGVIYAGKFEGSKNKKCTIYDSEIDKLYVLPTFKNKGIGAQLLKACLEKLRKKGYKKTIVFCLSKNKSANSFYEKHGGAFITQFKYKFDEIMNAYGFDLI